MEFQLDHALGGSIEIIIASRAFGLFYLSQSLLAARPAFMRWDG